MLDKIAQALGIDQASPEQLRADFLVDSDASFHRDLVMLRRKKGLRQKDVAIALGISQPAVAEFERDGSDPRLSTLRRYAHAIGALVGHVVSDADAFDLASGQKVRATFLVSKPSTHSVPAAWNHHISETMVRNLNSADYANTKRGDFALAC